LEFSIIMPDKSFKCHCAPAQIQNKVTNITGNLKAMLDTRLRDVINTDKSNFKPYDRYGATVAGMHWIPLSGELRNGKFECFLLRMDAGAVSKPHEHTGHEEFMVLDGVLVDCDGTEYQSGDYVHLHPGSKHSSRTPDGCLLLVILRGNNRPLSEAELAD